MGDGHTTSAFVAVRYTARGLRASETLQGVRPAVYQTFRYRGAQLAQDVVTGTSTTPFTETFVYRPDGSPLELLYQVQGQAAARYWYVEDEQGSVVLLVDATGTPVDRYAYDLWG